MKPGVLALLALFSLRPLHAAGWPEATPSGRWLTANHDAVIQIAPCGSNLCGQIVGIARGPSDPVPLDWRGKAQCGLTILQTSPVRNDAGEVHWAGTILDPRNGDVYKATIALDTDRHLKLRGYIGLPIFGQTQTWLPYAGRTMDDCRMDPGMTN